VPHTGPIAVAQIPESTWDSSPAGFLGGVPWPVLAFISLMMLPPEFGFYVGELRLSAYRVLLLLLFIPCFVRLVNGTVGRLIPSDFCVMFHVLWGIIVMAVHHGMDQATKSGGIYMVEVLGAYLIGRCYVRSERAMRATAWVLLLAVMLMSITTIPEMLTGRHFIRETAATLTSQSFVSEIEPRMGLTRAYGSFEHPILYGVFCGSVFGLAWYLPSRRASQTASRLGRCGLVVVSTLTSVSSGALAGLMIQVLLTTWAVLMRSVRGRWLILVALFSGVYILIDRVSNRRAIEVMLSYLTFSADTAYGRVQIWDYGSLEMWRHPVFGIGLNDWARPEWFDSGSMDNFWLVLGVTYGLPGALSMIASVVLICRGAGRAIRAHPALAPCGMGWIMSIVGLAISACTVHLWNALLVYFCFLLGMGAWMVQVGSARPEPIRAS